MRYLTIFLAFTIISFAQLSELKEQSFKLKSDKAKIDNDVLKNSWINQLKIQANLDRSKNQNREDISISLNQDIFRSGGIFYAIEYAKIKSIYNLNTIEKEKIQMLYSVYRFSLELKKIDFEIEKQKILIKNSKIDIKMKEERYENGLLDIADLDEAIINLNNLENALQSLKEQKAINLQNIKNISDINYLDIEVNQLNIPNLEQFLEKNFISLQKNVIDIKSKLLDMQKADFLPKLTVNSSYGYDNDKSDDSYNFILSLSMPIDFDYKKKIESKKLDYLIEKLNLKDMKNQEIRAFETFKYKIYSIDKKIENTKNIIARYSNLKNRIAELFKSGLKTEDDLTIISNTKKTKELDLKTFRLERENLILELLSRGDFR